MAFGWIHEFLSNHFLEKKLFPEFATETTFFDRLEDGFVIYPFGVKSPENLLQKERIGIKPNEVNKLCGIDTKICNSSFVIHQPVYFSL